MPPPQDSSGLGGLAPEFHGATPWVIDMGDAQRVAHAAQMSANAEKTRAEAAEIRGRNRWDKFWYGLACGVAGGLTFVTGFISGAVYWATR